MLKRRTLRFVPDASESGSSKLTVKEQGNKDVHRVCNTDTYPMGVVFISAWASALLVQTVKAMPEPRCVGRVTSELPRFFVCSHEKQTESTSWE